ncbi:MAG: DUF4105 domain-containing protein [Prevotellaceae bacterium]|jgi:hypothetical protein|nr:DUF4105 domain-containing protein [Prevotellaceae bacterium]
MKLYRIIIILVCAVFINTIKAQQLSDSAQISLLTCGAGNQLYSTFGHSAIRICDKKNNIDLVFNYGTFNFSTPNFYLKFSRGTLIYMLSVNNFRDFLQNYKYENRSVYEQKLNITQDEKEKLFSLLIENYEPQNRNYRYDFFKDNCSTRIRDAFQKAIGEKLKFHNQNTTGNKTFRELICPYLEKMQWSKFGIDILLGMPTDMRATNADYMFLPNELLKNVDTATINGIKFASPVEVLYQAHKISISKPLSPILAFFAFMAIIILLSLLEFRYLLKNRKINLKIFDRTFFAILAILSLIILLMWIFSLHYPVRNNLNILWLNPLYLYVFFKLEKSNFYIILICIICNLTVLCGQCFLPQHFNTAFFAIIIAATMRLIMLTAKMHIKIKQNSLCRLLNHFKIILLN